MIRKLFLALLVLPLLLIFNFKAVYADVYGAGSYSGDFYGGVSPSSSSSSDGGGGGGCNSSTPTSAPDLFEIDRNKDTATLYFKPAGEPYDGYLISYGYTKDANNFALKFNMSQVRWVINFKINSLNARTPYYFKIQATNGCTAGAFSESVLAGSAPLTGNKVARYYKTKSSVANTFYRVTSFVNSVRTVTPSKTPQPVETYTPAAPQTNYTPSTITTTDVTPPVINNYVNTTQVPVVKTTVPWWQKLLQFLKI